MENDSAASKAESLSDLELAMLLCLMSSSHGIIQATLADLEDLEKELKLAARHTFGLAAISIKCTPSMTLDDFTSSLLIDGVPLEHSTDYTSKDDSRLPNVLVIRDLHLTSRTIQMQAMELFNSRRIFTHTTIHPAPKHFLALLTSIEGCEPFVNHLKDFMYLSHLHDSEDGFPNTLEAPLVSEDEPVLYKSLFTSENIDELSSSASAVTITIEVMRYIQDIVVFLRMHRAVAAGMTPLATQYFVNMCKSLACLHELQYVTPSLVGLAAIKVFRHRLVFVTPATERSMQYGSDVASVAAMLKDITPESAIEDVLADVDCPL